MISELNGQENYFTRICAGGLLNTRKLELAHMLLQDINMFHMHPSKMPNSNSDNTRLISSAISNMALNDRKIVKKSKQLPAAELPCKLSASSSSLVKSSSNTTLAVSVAHSPQLSVKLNTSKTEANLNRPNTGSSSHHYYHSQYQNDATQNETRDEIESSINDLASFMLYASRKPLQVYQPIKDHTSLNNNTILSGSESAKMKHNVSYIELDDNLKLDHHILQALQNGFTFTCVLNEQDIAQSNFLLNIRLESDNSTLVWSRPAWDITNSWSNTAVPSVNTATNTTGLGKNNSLNQHWHCISRKKKKFPVII